MTQCQESIEKEWPGHMAVLWRRQCKNKAKKGYTRCWVHLPAYEARQRLREARDKYWTSR